MGYGRTGYRRGYQGRQTAGRVAKANARPGPCRSCHVEIPAGGGQLWREADGSWSVIHSPAEWIGSPVSGQYIGGCPAETDRMNREGKFGGEDRTRPEAERIAAVAATYAATHREAPARRPRYAARYGRCTHEDYPCCGCGE